MTTARILATSRFWADLDEIRTSLVQNPDNPEVRERAIARLAGLLACSETVASEQAARRRSVLAGFAETYQLGALPDDTGPALPMSVDQLVTRRSPGVSLVTCSKNRTGNLMRALPSWLAQDRISEIVIVDWSSDRPVRVDLAEAGFDDPRIHIARVEDEPRWILSYAFNLGFRLARFDRVLKVDADIELAPDFFDRNPLAPHRFIAGNWRLAGAGQAYVNGFFYVFHATLMSVKGFNEHITTYGWDDDDIYGRFVEMAGLSRTDVATGSVSHLEHDDEQRLGSGGTRNSAHDDLAALPLFNIRTNRFIAAIMPAWDGNRTLLPFTALRREAGQLVLRRGNRAPHPVPAHVADTARRLASYELVSWRAGLRTWDLEWPAFDALLARHRLDAITAAMIDAARQVPPAAAAVSAMPASPSASHPAAPAVTPDKGRIFIDAQHGLGNRLRAIGSAGAIAQATGREMVVVWQPDHHCDCRMTDLFDYKGAVIETTFLDAAIDDKATVLNYMEIEPGGAKGVPLALESGRDAYLRSAFVIAHPASTWESENRVLRDLRPTGAVTELLDGLPECEIGVHIRMEGAPGLDQKSYDRAENWSAESHAAINHWRGASHWSRFLARLKPLLEVRPEARIFLAADLPETYAAMSAALGDRLVVIERHAFDRSAAQLRYALADILGMARTQLFFGSHWSSFSEATLRMSFTINRHEMSGLDF